MQIPPRGASRQMGEIYAKIFLVIYLFFRNTPTGQTLRPIFARDGSNDAVVAQGCAFWGLKNLKLIFNVFIQKIQKNYNGAYGEN